MNRIASTFELLKREHAHALIPYITPEYPVAGSTVPMILALARAGASMIEVGIPFSDPLADGPTIQHSSYRAIENGVTIPRIFEAVREARKTTQVPIILMGYINPILHYGIEKFFAEAGACGVDGTIVPDLLPDDSAEYRRCAEAHGISPVFLIAPTSTDERIRLIDQCSGIFSYCVSVTGVTGARTALGGDGGIAPFLKRVRSLTTKPFVVGFGISRKEHVDEVCAYADGAVVGSALINAVGQETTPERAAERASEFLHQLSHGV
ncbi:MAG TPA: tryptophan synthase subunit alpha [Bacteroidota bacterium]|nr:tryptophan synthase subunit alpha [Bacteroidota bacterium]